MMETYRWSTLTGIIAAASFTLMLVFFSTGMSAAWVTSAGVVATASLTALFVLLFEESEYDPWADFYSQSSWTNIRDNDLTWESFEETRDRQMRLIESLRSAQAGDAERADEAIPVLEEEVEHPSHYTSYSVELIEITSRLDFCLGNAVKYVVRDGLKSGATKDLEKALEYIELRRENPPVDDEGAHADRMDDPKFIEDVRALHSEMVAEGRLDHGDAFWLLCHNHLSAAENMIIEILEERDNVH